jgi:LPXTG-motif cell wall-anchored protein
MQGVRVTLLVSAYVLLASLAAPTLLFASEETDPPPPAQTPPGPPEETTVPAQPAPQVDPEAANGTGEGEAATSTPMQLPTEPRADASGKATKGKRSAPRAGKGARAKAAAEIVVAMRDIKFKPRNIGIGVGDTVIWENEDPERHNALGEDSSFETPIISEGETSRHTFNRKGRFPYFCSLHQGMVGTITVGSSSNGGGSGSGGGGSGTGTTSTGSGTSSLGSTGSSSSLPATGEDLAWLALIGTGLVTLGAALALLLYRRPWI